MANKELTHLSLCSGYGGLDLSVKRVFPNVRTVVYVEREISACKILDHQMEQGRIDVAPIWSDLKTFEAKRFRGKIDIISGGYPCQPFSVAGKQKGTADERHLWPYISKIIEDSRPALCVFENVRGHVRLGLSEVLRELRGLGYRVRAGIFSAAEVGAPHRRERVFVIAVADGIGERLQGHAWDEPLPPGRSRKNGPAPARSISTMDHAICKRSGRRKDKTPSRPHDQRQNENEKLQVARSCDGILANAWPSGPGEEQYEWERPRTLGGLLNPQWVCQLMGLPYDWVDVTGLTREMKLRALGNGVVPQQGEHAIRCLLQKML